MPEKMEFLMKLFEIDNLTFYYPNEREPALKELSLSVESGDFFVICGKSGCGKSTLLRQLKPELAPHGTKSGGILFKGEDVYGLKDAVSAAKIGFVQQSPENQIVTDKVWHELAFGLESLGFDTPSIRRRVAEMASFFGIQNWFYKDVSELSGGQKQLLNLASVMVMQPEVLILDEPTSQLDPIAASDFLATLSKINKELGTTIILTEHRLEEALVLANRCAVLEKGRLFAVGNVTDAAEKLRIAKNGMFYAMPAAMRVWASVGSQLQCPVSVNEGRTFLQKMVGEGETTKVENDSCGKETISDASLDDAIRRDNEPSEKGEDKKDAGSAVDMNVPDAVIKAENLWFRYTKDGADVVKGLNLCVGRGEFYCILGGNGTGKTTSVKLLTGICRAYRGDITVSGKVGYLPQNPQTLFVRKTVLDDLLEVSGAKGIAKGEAAERIGHVLALCRLEGYEERHPFDLSGGEQQRLALAKLLLLDPEILILDEPTKGLDAEFKLVFAGILKKLLAAGVTILMVSHDVDFCASYASRCALFFDGAIVTEGTPREFFSGNSFYTTSANRMSRGIIKGAVTVGDIITEIGGTPEELSEQRITDYIPRRLTETEKKKESLPLWRKIGAVVSGISALVFFFMSVKPESLNKVITGEGLTSYAYELIPIYLGLIGSIALLMAFTARKQKPPVRELPEKNRRKLSKRTRFAVALILVLIPVTLYVGFFYLGYRQYYAISFAVLIECMLPFFMIFEGRHPESRELVVIAVLCALGIAGRAAFFMLPSFKPVMAITIIAGIAFGGETGFLVGAVTMLASNVLFSQGPWTPWQMFTMGIIGFIAGILYRKGLLRRRRLSMCIFGAFCAIVIYGGIMNPASALIWGKETLNAQVLLTYYLSGIPVDCVHACATFIFLWFLGEPMLEKMDRIKEKYGMME